MPAFHAGALSPQNVVLGLLSEERGTVADLALRVGERLPEAGFPRNAAHSAVKNLRKKRDCVRVRNPGAESSRLVYEVAPGGLRHLRRWICSPPKLPLGMRDPIQAKLEFAQPQDLLILLQRIEEEERALAAQRNKAHDALLSCGPVRRGAPWGVGLRRIQARELVLLLRLMSECRGALLSHVNAYVAASPELFADCSVGIGGLADNTAKLTPRLLALGLVDQQPDTPAGVASRLDELFADARYARTSVYENLPSLERDGLVRVVGDARDAGTTVSMGTVRDGVLAVEELDGEESTAVYGVTPAGADYIRAWVCGPLSVPPGVRDVLRGKVQFLRPEELPAVLRTISMEERAFSVASNLAHARLHEERLERREHTKQRRAGGPPLPWRAELRFIRTFHAANMWQMMSRRRAHLLKDLQRLAATVDGDAPSRSPRSVQAEAS